MFLEILSKNFELCLKLKCDLFFFCESIDRFFGDFEKVGIFVVRNSDDLLLRIKLVIEGNGG